MINDQEAYKESVAQTMMVTNHLFYHAIPFDAKELSPKEQLTHGDVRLTGLPKEMSLELKSDASSPGSVCISVDQLASFDKRGKYVCSQRAPDGKYSHRLTWVFDTEFVHGYLKSVPQANPIERAVYSGISSFYRIFIFKNQLHNAETLESFARLVR